MKVLKFGGTSVGTVESLRNVKYIVEHLDSPAVVVVSALGGLTDRLIATAGMARNGDSAFRTEMDAMVKRHHDIINELVPSDKKESLTRQVDLLLAELRRIYEGVELLHDLPARTLDQIVSFGERMSSLMVSSIVDGAHHLDSLQIVKTEKWFSKNIADLALTTANIKHTFRDYPYALTVMGGFISTDRETGEITNLGRGGSDYTAAIVAAALNAEVLDIWTDVDGFMTSDPRIIPDARVIDRMTFVESMELCSFGAKVIYPPTIYPVFHNNIPIRILNTFNLSAPGTFISDSAPDPESIARGISAVKDTALVSISGQSTDNVASINSRMLNALAKRGISVYLVSQPGEEDYELSFAVAGSDGRNAGEALADEFAPEIQSREIDYITVRDGLATIAVVGEKLTAAKGVSARIYNTLMRGGIEVLAASAEKASATTLAFVVSRDMVDDALRLVHASLF